MELFTVNYGALEVQAKYQTQYNHGLSYHHHLITCNVRSGLGQDKISITA